MAQRIEVKQDDVRLVIQKHLDGSIMISVYYLDVDGFEDSEDFNIPTDKLKEIIK